MQIGPFWCWFQGGWVFVCSRTLWVSPTNSLVGLGVSPTASTTTDFFQSEVLRLYFPTLDPWVVWSVLLPSCSSQFICMEMWDHPFHQLLPHHESLHPGCLPMPLLPIWVNVYLTPRLVDFHTVQFSGSSGCFLFSYLLLSFFWLCMEAQCILCLHLGQKSRNFKLF